MFYREGRAMIKVAFFDAKAYDKPSFEQYGSLYDLRFKYLETKLNEDTVDLAKGCDAVCVFVNDTVNAAVIDRLHEYGVRLIAPTACVSSPSLSCALYVNMC